VTEKFEFIDAKRAAEATELPTVARMCALLEVSKSGFYEWRGRPVSAAQRRRELLAEKIRTLFEAFDGTYGYRRIHAQLARAGERVGPKLVRKLMREMGLIPVQPRPFRTTTEPDPDAPGTVDLVKRDFTAQRPGTKVVGDITYIRTWRGWLYLDTTSCPVRRLGLAGSAPAAATSRRRGRCRVRSDRAFQVLQRALQVVEQTLQVRNAAPAPDEPEVQVARVVGQRDVERLAIQRYGQRVVAVQPGTLPVHRLSHTWHIRDDNVERRWRGRHKPRQRRE